MKIITTGVCLLASVLCLALVDAEGKNETLQLNRFSLKENIKPEGQLLTTLPELSQEYSLSFELKANSFEAGWRSLIELRINGTAGRRILLMKVRKDNSTDGSTDGWWFGAAAVVGNGWRDRSWLPDNYGSHEPKYEWIRVELSQRLIIAEQSIYSNDRQNFMIKIGIRDGSNDEKRPSPEYIVHILNQDPEVLRNVKLYAGSPDMKGLDGFIRNIQISTVSTVTAENSSTMVGLTISLGILVVASLLESAN